MKQTSIRLTGHAIRLGEYEPFNPQGPWPVECVCGATTQAQSITQAKRWFRQHKQQVREAKP